MSKLIKVIRKPHELPCFIADKHLENLGYSHRFVDLDEWLTGRGVGYYNYYKKADVCDVKEGDYVVKERDGWNVYKPKEFNKKFNIVKEDE